MQDDNFNKRLRFILALILIWIGGISAPARAGSGGDETSLKLDELTVTAQKREENPQDIPISMDVLSDLFIEDAMMESSLDLTRFSANVFMKDSPFENVIVIRGISSFGSSLFSPAAYYINGVGYSMHYMHDNELLDVERVEILKGPQGTLYGQNSESGVVHIITRQPDNHFRADVLGEYGNYNTYRGNLKASGPIVKDHAYLGIAAQYKHTDGFVENLYNADDTAGSQSHFNGRATLRWTPSDPWDISLIAGMVDADDNVGVYRYDKGANTTDPFETRHDETSEDFSEAGNSQVLNINFKANAFKVTSVTGATYRTYTKNNDSDGWDDPTRRMTNDYTYDDRQYTQEIRIGSTSPGNLEWLGGVFASQEEISLDHENMNLSANQLRSHHVVEIDSKGYAAFGQTTYTVRDRLHLTLGLRFDNRELEGDYQNRANQTALQKDLSFTEWLPKASLSVDLSPSAMGYATVAKGYLAGGFNWCMNPTENTFHFDPEYSWNYETGLKTTWLDNKMMANVSLFYITIDDKQVSVVEPDTQLNTITNAAKAYSYGAELQLKVKPMAGLEIFANAGYTRAEFDEFDSTGWNASYTEVVSSDLSGNTLPYAPEYTCNAGIQYRAPSGLMGRIDWLGTGGFYADAANTSKQDAYQLVNLRLGYEGNHWETYLWVKNAFDEEYLTWFSPSGSNLWALDGPPRTYGVTVRYRF